METCTVKIACGDVVTQSCRTVLPCHGSTVFSLKHRAIFYRVTVRLYNYKERGVGRDAVVEKPSDEKLGGEKPGREKINNKKTGKGKIG